MKEVKSLDLLGVKNEKKKKKRFHTYDSNAMLLMYNTVFPRKNHNSGNSLFELIKAQNMKSGPYIEII